QFGFPDDYRDPVKLRQLTAYFKLLKRLGSSADQLWQWAGPTLSATQATAIKQTARARFDDTAWLERAQPLRNMLRAEQREALLAYLVANLPVRDANDLFGRYLIDVEMDPCMLTSRIKQAISSVQLFVQRCLMNLENEQSVPPSAVDLDQWNWMKNYRVWEANRKVFVYPENWIEPELRDDKTPFFTELESELLQGDITADKAEQAFSLYLEKLDEVAHLEIVGMFHESGDTGATDVLHVFGRTFGTPHVYYYRRCVDASRWATWKRDESGAHSIKLREATSLFANQWSAWERVDLDIEGDHLIPVVWKQRLYLFWAVFLEKAREPDTLESQKGKKPDKDWEIQLGWSEYRNGRWSAKKLGPQAPFKHPERIYEGIDWTQVFAKEKFFFKGISGADELTIWCYGPAEVS
ncbi:MAG TPA: neuraminidase-like domain-containing protein, partial [Caldilineaceae bacterium]|nr:neuraminidase-like domain-containing protein [Caldilineaceae bacterium]